MTTFEDLLKSVCKRPAMYVGRGDFELAAAFFDGYHSALVDVLPDAQDAGLSCFREWLAVRLDSCLRSHWSEIIRREDTGSNKFEALERLYEEFSRDRSARGTGAILADYKRLESAVFQGLRNRHCWCEDWPSDPSE
jgi:hypothetical protein